MMNIPNKVALSAAIYLVGLSLYIQSGLPTPGNSGLILLGIAIYCLFTIWFWIARRYPLLGWFLFGLVSGRRSRLPTVVVNP